MHEESTGFPFQKSTDEVTKKECETIDLAMTFLVQKLGYAASKNQILQLSDVWERYCSLVAQTNGDIPQSFISRRTTFKEYLQNRLSDEYQLQHIVVGSLTTNA
jgi:hypothetical protein